MGYHRIHVIALSVDVYPYLDELSYRKKEKKNK